MIPFLQFDKIDYEHTGNCLWDARVGCIDIAHIWSPRKGTRDMYMVRLCFEQERGKVDFTKDKYFKTFDEVKRYIDIRFKKMIVCLALNYDVIKWKQVKNKKM